MFAFLTHLYLYQDSDGDDEEESEKPKANVTHEEEESGEVTLNAMTSCTVQLPTTLTLIFISCLLP